MRTGVVIGKFLPPHLGHLHLIREARRRCDHLTVLVCTLSREEIPGELRFQWMRELVPCAEVIHVTDENPQEPHEHPDFWAIWRHTILSRCRPDVVFTSEEYGDPLAATLGAVHECIDLPRAHVPISARKIRSDPMQYWEFIPEPVRPYYVKRVVVTGPESTGKTTLAEDLAKHFQTVWVPEFARGYLDDKHARQPSDVLCEFSDLAPIARCQVDSLETAARAANRLVISDTDAIVTSVYAHHYFGECPKEVADLAAEQRADLHLLLDVDVPWVEDRQRDRPHQRQEMFDLFRAALGDRRYIRIHGTWEQRFQTAVAAILSLGVPSPPPHR